jgi:hypothetical protein
MARYRFDAKTGNMLTLDEKSGEWKPERKRKGKPHDKWDYNRAFYVMPDIKEFVSPIDGSLISSRSKLRHHNRGHNVRQCGDWKPGEIVARQDARQREAIKKAEGIVAQWV